MTDIDLTEYVPGESSQPPTHKRGLKEKLTHIRQRIALYLVDPKKRLLVLSVFGLVTIALFAVGLYFMTRDVAVKTDEIKVEKPATIVASGNDQAPLDGVMTSAEAASRHPLAVIVENHPDARPQAGLDKASIVYEAIAEGGITRFMAIYGTEEAEKVGPVRSVRTYFIDWASGYNAYLSHVGGNIDALDQIKAEKSLDLDQFTYPSSYWRDRNRSVASEHTMYTSTTKLREQAKTNGYSTANNFNVFKFKDDPTAAEQDALPQSQKAKINFSSAQYAIEFDYDRETNSYKRKMAGSVHTDQITKNQITAKNIVAMTVDRRATVTRINEPGWDMDIVGGGKAKIFLDGKMIEGTWKKASKADRELFYDESGNEIIFNRGRFWIAVVPPDGTATAE
ncbi:MAG: DUF3048 domain-containing protein [Patescibacteria group bacterium]